MSPGHFSHRASPAFFLKFECSAPGIAMPLPNSEEDLYIAWALAVYKSSNSWLRPLAERHTSGL